MKCFVCKSLEREAERRHRWKGFRELWLSEWEENCNLLRMLKYRKYKCHIFPLFYYVEEKIIFQLHINVNYFPASDVFLVKGKAMKGSTISWQGEDRGRLQTLPQRAAEGWAGSRPGIRSVKGELEKMVSLVTLPMRSSLESLSLSHTSKNTSFPIGFSWKFSV